METYIAEILSTLGLGVNGIMPICSDLYIGRLQNLTRNFTFECVSNSKNYLNLKAKNNGSYFYMSISFEEESRRISNITVSKSMTENITLKKAI